MLTMKEINKQKNIIKNVFQRANRIRLACFKSTHGIKGFVTPTKSFVKIGITKIFCYNNKMFSSIDKTFGCSAKFSVEATKNLFVVPNFVAVTKPFFSVIAKKLLNPVIRCNISYLASEMLCSVGHSLPPLKV